MVHRLEAEYWERVDFVYLHQYDEANNAVFERYSMVGRPVFVLITPDGTEVTTWFGAKSEEEMRQILDDYLASV
ncbi:MAG: hypothetical protein H7Y11_01180 [Armatimonadetes bacterium]|nr:hypothetical protein [Anaerolineae bacterium]